MSNKTMKFHGVTARIGSECRYVAQDPKLKVPDRLTAAWMSEICSTIGADKFHVVTLRRIYWNPRAVMCSCSASWERTQTITRGPLRIGVSDVKVRVFDSAGY